MSKQAGHQPELICRPSLTAPDPASPQTASTALGHRWPFNKAGYSLMQANNAVHLKAACGTRINHFLSLSLSFVQNFYSCLAIKVKILSKS